MVNSGNERNLITFVVIFDYKLSTETNCRLKAWRKDKMMSSRHDPNVVGHSCVTKVMTKLFIGVSH